MLFLDELLGLFRYPPKSGRALLGGTLPLRYCVARFACSTPTWRLPASGHVDRLIASHSGAGDCRGKVVRVHPVSGSGPIFCVKSGPGSPCSSHLEIGTLFLRAVSDSHRVRQSTVLLEEFHLFSTCLFVPVPCAVRT